MDTKKAIKRARCALKHADAALKEAGAAIGKHAISAAQYHDAATPPPDFLTRQLNLPASPNGGLAAAVRILQSKGPGAFKVGDEIEVTHKALGRMRWAVIGIDADKVPGKDHTLTVQAILLREGRSFDTPDLDHPYGRNTWHTSSVRRYLNGEFMDGLAADDRAAIQPTERKTYSFTNEECIHTNDMVFLLSASEAGFPISESVADEGTPYPYYKCGNEARQLTDADGKARYWWLRSPGPWGAGGVRIVPPSGALNSYGFASFGNGLAAACVIG